MWSILSGVFLLRDPSLCLFLSPGYDNARGGHLVDAHAPPANGPGKGAEVHPARWKQNHWHRPGHRYSDSYRRRPSQLGLKWFFTEEAVWNGGRGGMDNGREMMDFFWFFFPLWVGVWTQSNMILDNLWFMKSCTTVKKKQLRRMHGFFVQYHPTKTSALSLSVRLSKYCHLCNKMYLI